MSLLNASIGDVMGLGSRNSAMSQANRATDSDAFSSRNNPAALSKIKKGHFTGGHRYSTFDMEEIKLDNSLSGLPDDQNSPSNSLKSMEFGASFLLGEKLSVGMTSIFPVDSFLKIHTLTGNEVTYLHFNERQQRPQIHTSFGYALTSSLSVGAGFFYSLSANGNIQAGLSDQDTQARLFLEVHPFLIPFTGLHVEIPTSSGRFLAGLVFQAQQSETSQLSFDMRLGINGLGSIPFTGEAFLIPFYDPAQLVLGLGYESTGYEVHLAGEINYWSRYKSSMVLVTGDVQDISQVQSYPIVLQDTYSLRLGGELKNIFSSRSFPVHARGGVEYHTSALPENPESVSVIDSDRWGISGGLGVEFSNPGFFIERPFHLDMAFKYVELMDESFSSTNGRSINSNGNMISVFGGVGFEF